MSSGSEKGGECCDVKVKTSWHHRVLGSCCASRLLGEPADPGCRHSVIRVLHGWAMSHDLEDTVQVIV